MIVALNPPKTHPVFSNRGDCSFKMSSKGGCVSLTLVIVALKCYNGDLAFTTLSVPLKTLWKRSYINNPKWLSILVHDNWHLVSTSLGDCRFKKAIKAILYTQPSRRLTSGASDEHTPWQKLGRKFRNPIQSCLRHPVASPITASWSNARETPWNLNWSW